MNDARILKTMKRLPPTQNALLQHSKRVLDIRLEYGAPVNTVNRIGLLQKVGAGHLMRTVNRGFQCGTGKMDKENVK